MVWKMTWVIWKTFTVTLQNQNWYFYGILWSKVENASAKNLWRNYV